MDLEKSFLCGFLTIENLTDACPAVSTYFEAEIIGPHHSFYTGKWNSSPSIDIQHWV